MSKQHSHKRSAEQHSVARIGFGVSETLGGLGVLTAQHPTIPLNTVCIELCRTIVGVTDTSIDRVDDEDSKSLEDVIAELDERSSSFVCSFIEGLANILSVVPPLFYNLTVSVAVGFKTSEH